MSPLGAPLCCCLGERGDLGAALVDLRAAVTVAIVHPSREDGLAVLELEVQVAVGVGGVEQLGWDRWDLYRVPLCRATMRPLAKPGTDGSIIRAMRPWRITGDGTGVPVDRRPDGRTTSR